MLFYNCSFKFLNFDRYFICSSASIPSFVSFKMLSAFLKCSGITDDLSKLIISFSILLALAPNSSINSFNIVAMSKFIQFY